MNSLIYFTTAIDYMNGVPHIGHAYEKCQTDTFARYFRLFGSDVFFLTGSDEHGQKVAEAAKKTGLSCQAQVNDVLVNFKRLLLDLHITNDDFIRTTEERHKKVVIQVLADLYERGEIYSGSFEGLYCVGDERFWTEKDIEDDKCPLCHREVQKVSEKNYFFKMGQYQDWLIEHIESNPLFIQPENRRNEILGKLKAEPLKDLCISRPKDRLNWGITLPFDEDFVTYVWFDALFNYITGIDPLEESNPGRFSTYWKNCHHIIGKDIAHTHCIYWPIMLKASGYSLPVSVVVHGHILDKEGRKMSKSLGNTVDPFELIGTYGSDVLRFYLVTGMRPGLDSNFSEDDLITRYNSELANDFGNLVQRTLTMIMKYQGGKVTKPASLSSFGSEIIGFYEQKVTAVRGEIEKFNIPDAFSNILDISRRLNKMVVEKKPWELAKNESTSEELAEVLYLLFAGVRITGLLMTPLFPEKIEAILQQLNCENQRELCSTSFSREHSIGEPSVIFPRIEVKSKKDPGTCGQQAKSKKKQAVAGLISIDDVKKVKLKTGIIREAEEAPGSDKLYLLKVEVGGRQMKLVAGIRTHYKKEDLINKIVIVVSNLAPAKIMDFQSEGMLLAASKKDKMSLLTVDLADFPSGANVR